MKLECNDRENVLRNQVPAEMRALAEHAENCPACAQELRVWNDISSAARTMHTEWDSPYLWPKIRRALEAESQSAPEQSSWNISRWLRFPAHQWQAAAAVLALALITTFGVWYARGGRPSFFARKSNVTSTPQSQRRLLTEQAVQEADNAEAAYLKSIDKLSALAEPKLDHPATPLMASYREKLLLLDAAIAECRSNIDKNQSNPRLRRELLSIYQQKQRTLEEVVQEE